MAWLDYTFLGIVLISLLIGLFRGFVREALSLATWILAFVLALRYGALMALRLQNLIHSEATRIATGYALVFLGVLLTGAILTYLISLLIRGSGLRPVDRTLGAGFGLLRGALLVVAFVLFASMGSLQRESWFQQSRLAPRLKPAAEKLQSLIPERWLAYFKASPAVTSPQPEH